MSNVIIMLLRQVLLIGGTWLATKGVIESAQVEAFVGIALTVAAAVWRWVEHYIATKKAAQP